MESHPHTVPPATGKTERNGCLTGSFRRGGNERSVECCWPTKAGLRYLDCEVFGAGIIIGNSYYKPGSDSKKDVEIKSYSEIDSVDVQYVLYSQLYSTT